MIADIGLTVSIVRDENGDNPDFLNTAWTLKLGRSLIKGSLVFFGAPLIATLYHAPEITAAIRVFSLWFIIDGFESISFPLAVRRKNARLVLYVELGASIASTAFTIVYCYFSRNFWGMLYGILFNRMLIVLLSYCFYRELRPKLQIERKAARNLLAFARYAMPSSLLTLVLNQYDKAVFLRFFDLRLLGIYGLAASISYPVESLINKVSQMVLYPRCAHNYRADKATFSLRYYTENWKLFVGTLAMPAIIGGTAPLIVHLLYDTRYAAAGEVLRGFMARAFVLSFASPAEEMLIASGENRIFLMGNVLRALWLVLGSIGGYYAFGFLGFVYGIALSGIPSLVYYLWLQNKKGFLIVKYELCKLAYVAVVALSAYAAASILLALWPTIHIRT
jgi:lipopolysaccharide exporter